MERDNGLAVGLPLDEVERLYPKLLHISPYEPEFVTGESEAEFHRRAGSVLEHLVRSGSQSILVVSHGGILNAILRNALRAPLPALGGPYFSFGDTAFAQLFYAEHRFGWSVTQINDTRHLHLST